MAAPAPITAALYGCAGPSLTPAEQAFFHKVRPAGFILFGRNCETPDQVRALVADLRASAGQPEAPVLIDQEGGRVARLRPPHWRHPPPASVFGALFAAAPEAALEACRLNARWIAAELAALGIDVDCAPMLDVPQPGSHDIVGDRALARDPATVGLLARAWYAGFADGGVAPVAKHIPGHGRARADSHEALPVVEASRAELAATDFPPFKALADAPWAMTAHVLYTALDPDRPATTSPFILERIVRGEIGFRGALMSDDLSMKALGGDFDARAHACRAAGCDLALHCNGDMAEMEAVAEGAGTLAAASLARYRAALDWHRRAVAQSDSAGAGGASGARAFDRAAAGERLAALLALVA